MRARSAALVLLALAFAGCFLRKKTDAADAGPTAVAEPVASASAAPPPSEPQAVNVKDVARFQDEARLPGDAAKIEQPVVAHKSPPSGEKVALLPRGTSVTKFSQRGAFFLVTFANPSKPGETLAGWINDIAFKAPPALAKGQCRADADCRKPEKCLKGLTANDPAMCKLVCDMANPSSCPKGFDCAGEGIPVSGSAHAQYCVALRDDDDVKKPDAGASKPIAAGDAGASPAAVSFKVGDKVQVEWHGSWYGAQVIQVVGKSQWKIHYDGYEASWDEVVGPTRIKPR